jgi:hypothetical protein
MLIVTETKETLYLAHMLCYYSGMRIQMKKSATMIIKYWAKSFKIILFIRMWQ